MKEEKKEIEIGIITIVIIVLVVAVAPIVYSYFYSFFDPYFNIYYPDFIYISRNIFGWLLGICIPISVLLVIGIVTAVEGLKHIRRKEAEMYDLRVEPAYEENDTGDPVLSKKLTSVMSHVDSPNASDWRQAIIEADIILGDILNKAGYNGEGIGEQLKGATKADFKTLDQAWEAHKIRNQVAHEGSDFAMSQHEAKRVINLYRQVFEEFFYI